MALNGAEDIRRYIFGFRPVFVVPLLENVDGAAGNLDVEFDVLRQAGIREV